MEDLEGGEGRLDLESRTQEERAEKGMIGDRGRGRLMGIEQNGIDVLVFQ